MPASNSSNVSITWLVELLEAALAGSNNESHDSYLMVNNHRVSITVQDAKELLRKLIEQPLAEIVIVGNDLTATTAAQLLNVSDSHLERLCDAGGLPFRLVGTQRHLALRDVLKYREQRDAERKKHFREHVRAAAKAGEYDNPEEWVRP